MIIDGAVVTNGANRCELYIENSVPILRQKDILTEKEGNSPARRIYLAIQLMYIDEINLAHHHKTYWQLVQDFIQAAPSTLSVIEEISEYILRGRYYQALRRAKNLIDYEKEVIERVQQFA